jgi:hypothetical protein
LIFVHYFVSYLVVPYLIIVLMSVLLRSCDHAIVIVAINMDTYFVNGFYRVNLTFPNRSYTYIFNSNSRVCHKALIRAAIYKGRRRYSKYFFSNQQCNHITQVRYVDHMNDMFRSQVDSDCSHLFHVMESTGLATFGISSSSSSTEEEI